MKKILTIALAAAMMFAAAGQASAVPLETGGEYRARYWFLSNYNNSVAPHDSNMEFWDQRLRLRLGWQVSEGVKVNARADVLENVWETIPADKSEIDFDQVNVVFNLNPAMVISLGKMDVSWGTGLYAQADNRYRIKFAGKAGIVGYGIAWDKMVETFDTPGIGDDNGISVWAMGTFGGWNTGLLGLYRLNDFTPGVSTTTAGIDVYTKGGFGAIKLNAEAIYLFGTTDNTLTADIDNSGILAYVGAFMPLGPVNAGFEFCYASGNDPGTLDKNEGVAPSDYNQSFNSFILFNNFDLNGWNSVYSDGKDAGVNNALAVKASGTFNLNKQVGFMGALVYASAAQSAPGQDKAMGIEVDLLAKYMATENLTLQAGFGYLAAGEYYGKNVDDPWVTTAQAVVSF